MYIRLSGGKTSEGAIGIKLNLGNLNFVEAGDGLNGSVGAVTHTGKRPLKIPEVSIRINTGEIFPWI